MYKYKVVKNGSIIGSFNDVSKAYDLYRKVQDEAEKKKQGLRIDTYQVGWFWDSLLESKTVSNQY